MGSVGSKKAGGGIEIEIEPPTKERVTKQEIDNIRDNTTYIFDITNLTNEDLEYLRASTLDQIAFGDSSVENSVMLDSINEALAGEGFFISVKLGKFSPSELQKFKNILSKAQYSEQIITDINKLLQWYQLNKWPN